MDIRKLQNVFLLITSIAFYAIISPKTVIGLIIMILVNRKLGLVMEGSINSKKILIFSIVINLSVMVVFKYLNFLDYTLNQLLNIELGLEWKWAVPIGLSFFILRAIGYQMDIYKHKIGASKNFMHLGLYFVFFPTIVAGPFISFGEFQEQVENRKNTYKRFSVGICRFVVGLAKKVIIANNIGMIANQIFDLSTIGPSIYSVPASMAWLGVGAFSLYIYYEFSGYYDMAIGVSLIFGFKLPENFRYPYTSNSLIKFWSNWNVTVMAWFNEYVFKSLNHGFRKNKDATIRNMFITWILIGLWYGDSWNFLLWGIWNGLFLIVEEFFNFNNRHKQSLIYFIVMNLIIMLGWVVFRSKDLYQAGIYVGNMFCINNNGFLSDMTFMYIKENFVLLIIAIIFCLPIAPIINEKLIKQPLSKGARILTAVYPIVMLILCLLSLTYISVMGFGGFIFYRF